MNAYTGAMADMSGWATLRVLVETLFEKPETHGLRGVVDYARHLPSTDIGPGGTADLKAGTCVIWSMPQDDLDHHFEVRRLERLATSWRSQLPSRIDADGWADAECSIEVTRGRIEALVSRHDGEPDDSTVAIVQELRDGAWTSHVEISFVAQATASDLLEMDAAHVETMVADHRWDVGGIPMLHVAHADGEITVHYPVDALVPIGAAVATAA